MACEAENETEKEGEWARAQAEERTWKAGIADGEYGHEPSQKHKVKHDVAEHGRPKKHKAEAPCQAESCRHSQKLGRIMSQLLDVPLSDVLPTATPRTNPGCGSSGLRQARRAGSQSEVSMLSAVPTPSYACAACIGMGDGCAHIASNPVGACRSQLLRIMVFVLLNFYYITMVLDSSHDLLSCDS